MARYGTSVLISSPGNSVSFLSALLLWKLKMSGSSHSFISLITLVEDKMPELALTITNQNEEEGGSH